MGYRVAIEKDTVLFSLIGTSAIESKSDTLFNREFKEMDINARMMGLNIREDDFGFFINGFKDSQIKGAYFKEEFWEIIPSMINESSLSEISKMFNLVDTLDIVGGEYQADFILPKAILQLIDTKNKTLAFYGSSNIIKSILSSLNDSLPSEIILIEDTIENLPPLMEYIPQNIRVDMESANNLSNIKADILIGKLDGKEINSSNSVLDLSYQKRANYLNLTDVESEIAKIKTKEWRDKWKI
jgi:shikimate 5-dehydrogenase